jgi:hypothetical protein
MDQMKFATEYHKNKVAGIQLVSVFVLSLAVVIYLAATDTTTTSTEQQGGTQVFNVVPDVGNRHNPHKAWNDTPTIGMINGFKGTEAPANATSYPVTTPVPGGLQPDNPRVCATPTGYLAAMVKAWNNEDRHGLIESDGIIIDMGHPGAGGFYDTNGDGCCDTFCRRVVKGGWWSCVDPNTITSQYDAGKPRGTLCMQYGKRDV